MPKSVTFTYCGIEASGATVREAKASAAAKLASFVADASKGIELITFRGHSAIFWRAPDAFASVVLTESADKMRPAGPLYGSGHGSGATRADVIASVRLNLAQNAWSANVADDDAFVAEAFPHARPGTLGGDRAAELRRWIKFQRGYVRAKAAGLDDCEARDWCGGLGHLVSADRLASAGLPTYCDR